MNLVIVGGSDAGISAALRAKEIDPQAKVTVLLADDYPNFSICGLPYYVSGETPDWRSLAHRTEFPGIDVRRRHVARAIDVAGKAISVEAEGALRSMPYDKLIVATGAIPMRPDLPGADLEGVLLLHTMADSFAVHDRLAAGGVRRAVIVGAGYIGLEVADALTRRGVEVTLLSRTDTMMPTVDPALGRMVEETLVRGGVRVLTTASAERVEPGLRVVDAAGSSHDADLVLLAVGVRPETGLFADAGGRLGARGAIAVDPSMRRACRTCSRRAIAWRRIIACCPRRRGFHSARSRISRAASRERMRSAAARPSRGRSERRA